MVKQLLTKMRLCRNLTISLLIMDQNCLVNYSQLTQTTSVEITATPLLYFLTTPQEVIKATNELANKTSAGYDNISFNVMKKIIHHIKVPSFTIYPGYSVGWPSKIIGCNSAWRIVFWLTMSLHYWNSVVNAFTCLDCCAAKECHLII